MSECQLTEGIGFPIKNEYYEHTGKFRHDNKSTVKIFVESEDDRKLWLGVFKSNDRYIFDITTAFEFSCDNQSGGVISNGCCRLFKLVDNNEVTLGKYCLLCVDSDFSYISDNYLDKGKYILKNEFVYETCVHSKESINYSSVGINDDLNRVLGENILTYKIDVNLIYKVISKGYGKILPYLLCLYKDSHMMKFDYYIGKVNDVLYNEIEKIKLDEININNIDSSLMAKINAILVDVEKYIFENNLSQLLDSFKMKLNGDERMVDNAYLFIRGHNLKVIIKRFFTKIDKLVYGRRINNIYESNISIKQKKEKKRQIDNERINIDHFMICRGSAVDKIPFFSDTVNKIKEVYLL